jgi:hypothetical protein
VLFCFFCFFASCELELEQAQIIADGTGLFLFLFLPPITIAITIILRYASLLLASGSPVVCCVLCVVCCVLSANFEIPLLINSQKCDSKT